MNDSEEFNIIQLLCNYKTKENRKDLSDYLLTNCDSIHNISQVITDIIYDESKKVNNNETRNIIIELLKNFTKSCSHLRDDFSNVLVQTLIQESSEFNDYFGNYGQDYLKTSELNIPEKHKWNNVCETVNKKYTFLLSKNIQSGLIHLWYQNYFIKQNFTYAIPNKVFQNHNPENLLQLLLSLKNSSCELLGESVLQKNIDENKLITAPLEDSILFKFIYVLLDLTQNEHNTKLLEKILIRISASRHGSGIRFVEYIWMNKGNLQLSNNVYIVLLKYFRNFYEKPVIRLVIDILKHFNTENSDYEYECITEQTHVKDVLEICTLDVKLYCDVFLLFGKLLVLTNYDIRIVKLLKYIKTIS